MVGLIDWGLQVDNLMEELASERAAARSAAQSAAAAEAAQRSRINGLEAELSLKSEALAAAQEEARRCVR